jgi:hypothetical protein
MAVKSSFPPIRDIVSVPLNSVVYVLPNAIYMQQGVTKRQESYFTFGINFHSTDVH